jgi:hypothetical protein
MKRTTALLAAIAVCAMCFAVYADYLVSNEGQWPRSWPNELEPLRKQSRTLVGPMAPRIHYEIPFANRKDFETAWPHILKVKSKGAPLILVRAPNTTMGFKINAGVIVHCPPAEKDQQVNPEVPIPGPNRKIPDWLGTNYIELVVDGNIVDLNRIPLPADTLIIDERFKDEQRK